MAMSLTDVRLMVRNISDLDTTDLPNSVLDDFVKEAFQRIIVLERRWPKYQETYTFNTVANQRAYTIATIGDIREVISLVDTSTSGSRLTMIPYDNAEEIWLGNTDVASRPYFYALWDSALHLYAKPDAVYAITVRAYRNPLYTWLTTITNPIDCDEWFHILLVYFVLSRVYQRQEDPELSQMYLKSFEEGVAMARRDLMKTPSARPMLLSGGRQYPTMRRWLQTLGATLGT
ncbi:hypothetical protein UFOVP1335_38 [uncultured Caudovirales phage]|uniref:Uncharacterized protein n=1 Tax=uncultured Caudovirales phage TaxID=2100421 RepID=A0A6J5QE97_9CAUD|nr:hypothetical protein UFOVP914_4 [uncultured Caudovirales phage]CAB4182583.1 hypothetical protein UFOVP1091_8 [uncultured Caudovirales phage]CAB4199354.1 hypothetical protein UFOVP1335_38 [uncultured Caudovirales phage]CAB4212392.1 hypothetical protein UFOVP1445_8 [uncultured Caudovirales phage]